MKRPNQPQPLTMIEAIIPIGADRAGRAVVLLVRRRRRDRAEPGRAGGGGDDRL